jgi:hypothetical protein
MCGWVTTGYINMKNLCYPLTEDTKIDFSGGVKFSNM